LEDRASSAASVGSLSTLVTETTYAPGTRMGLLAPGILRWADVPQLAALVAPRRLIVAEGVTPQGQKLSQKDLREAFAFTQGVYQLYKMGAKLTVEADAPVAEVSASL
jgi:hypothetical protein